MQTAQFISYPASARLPVASRLAPFIRRRPYARATKFDAITTAWSWAICLVVTTACMALSRDCIHWFVIPVFGCGLLITLDLVDWLRGRFDVFDPVGLLGVFGFHWFFLSPLLQVVRGYWFITTANHPEDPITWLGWMSVLNLVGLLMYRYLRDFFAGRVNSPNRQVWTLRPMRFTILLAVLMFVSLVMETYFYVSRGGLVGFMEMYSRGDLALRNDSAIMAIFAESFPILAMMGYCVFARYRPALASWPAIVAVLVVFSVLALIFGGFRGSRSNTIIQIIWAVGMIHFLVRPFSKKMMFVGLACLWMFLYLYGFYKTGGLRSIELIRSGQDLDTMEQRTGRRAESLFLTELSRTELQSFILHQLCQRDFAYKYAWGRTFYAAACLIVPKKFWPDRPFPVAYETTEIEYGQGSFDPVDRVSSYVYGFVGESMLNVGIIGAPLAFLAWTFIVAKVRKWLFTWNIADVRLLLSGWLITFCIALFVSDSDNMFYFVFKYAALPFLVLYFSSQRSAIKQSYGARSKALAW